MEREEAIKYIKSRCIGSTEERDGTQWSEAMWTAIEALEMQDLCAEMLASAKDTNVLTKDLIRKEDALREARPEYLNPQQEKLASYNQGWNDALDEYFDRIKALQSAETQPITCDGCKHVGTYDTDFPCSGCIRREKDYYEQER